MSTGAKESPTTVIEAEAPDEDELAGSYSPQLLHDDEDEEQDAIDPEEDKAILVIWLFINLHI